MNHSNPERPIAPLIQAFLKAHGLEQRYNETRAVQAWPDIVGPTAAAHTTQISAKNGILFVKVSSAALKVELNKASEDILLKLQTRIACKAIHTLAIL